MTILAGLTTGAGAAQLAGTAVSVNPNAAAAVEETQRMLDAGADLFMGEQVITTASGQVQIVFTDDTHMVVGPNSALLIQEYLLRNDQSVSRFTVNALGGTFRFITGESDKNAYEIRTPTGTIGVRGTRFDLDVDWDTGDSATLLFDGNTINCADGGNCVVLKVSCELGLISKDKTSSIVGLDLDRQAFFENGFIYVEEQRRRLQSEFWVENARDCRPEIDRESVTASASPPPPPPPLPPPSPPPPPPPPAEDDNCNKGRGNGGECEESGQEAGNPGGQNSPPPGHCRNGRADCGGGGGDDEPEQADAGGGPSPPPGHCRNGKATVGCS